MESLKFKPNIISPKIIMSMENKYELAIINNKGEVETIPIPLSFFQNDTLIDSLEFLNKMNISSVTTLLELFTETKLYNLKFLFDWVLLFTNYDLINKEFDVQKNRSTTKQDYAQQVKLILKEKNVPGIIDFLELIVDNADEVKRYYGYFTQYTSEIRSMIINIILKLRNVNEFISKIDSSTETNKVLEHLAINLFSFNMDEVLSVCNLLKNDQNSSTEITTLSIILPKLLLLSKHEDNPYIELLKITAQRIHNNDLLKFIYLFLISDNQPYDEIKEFLINPSILISIKLIYILNKTNLEHIIKQLREIESCSKKFGKIKGLILSGTSNDSGDIIQSFMDKSDNLIVSFVLCKFFCKTDNKINNKITFEFTELLNKLELYNLRINLITKFSKISNLKATRDQMYEKDPKKDNDSVEFAMVCIFCGNKVQKTDTSRGQNYSINNQIIGQKEGKEIINYCNNPKCTKPLPVCCICLQPIEVEHEIINPKNAKQYMTNNASSNALIVKDQSENIESINIIWCLKCRHGGHYEHIQDWFKDLTICPNSNCDCVCLENNLMVI